MADDDIGDLLDEVERKYCFTKATPTPSAPGAVSKETVSMTRHHHGNRKPRAVVTTSRSTPTRVCSRSNDVIENDIIAEEEDLDKIISEIINEPEDTGAPPSSGIKRGRGRKVGPARSSPAFPSPPDKR